MKKKGSLKGKPPRMYLYIWRPSFLRDHTDGIAVALAPSLNEAIIAVARAYAGKRPAFASSSLEEYARYALWRADYDLVVAALRDEKPEIKRGCAAVVVYGGG